MVSMTKTRAISIGNMSMTLPMRWRKRRLQWLDGETMTTPIGRDQNRDAGEVANVLLAKMPHV